MPAVLCAGSIRLGQVDHMPFDYVLLIASVKYRDSRLRPVDVMKLLLQAAY